MKKICFSHKMTILFFWFVILGWLSPAFLLAQRGWEKKESMLTARWLPGYCSLNNKLYVFGGFIGNSDDILASAEVFDPTVNL